MKLVVVLTSLLCCAAAFPQLADEDLLEGSGVPPPLLDGLQEPLEIAGRPFEIAGESLEVLRKPLEIVVKPLEIVGIPLEILAEREPPKKAAPEAVVEEAAPAEEEASSAEAAVEAAPAEAAVEAAPAEAAVEAAPAEAAVEAVPAIEEAAQPAPAPVISSTSPVGVRPEDPVAPVLLEVAPRKSLPPSLLQRTSPVSVPRPPVSVPSTSFSSEDILSQSFETNDQGGFSYQFETSDGTAVDAAGQQKQIGDGVGTVMSGKYSYVAPNGQTITITWVADEGGFQASGDAIPKVPA